MKKKLLITAVLLLCLVGKTFAADAKTQNMEYEVKQKACQNAFSFINIDMSFMSPRATAADVSLNDSKLVDTKKDGSVPIANKKDAKPCVRPEVKPPMPMPEYKNKTSLFRIDLLHIFKIQIL